MPPVRHVTKRDFCPTCGREKPPPFHEDIQARVNRPCEQCGTQLGEIRLSLALNVWTCLGCYLRGVEGLLRAAA